MPVVKFDSADYERRAREAAVRGVNKAAAKLRNEVLRSINKQAPFLGLAKGAHKGAAPPRVYAKAVAGQPPRSITGKLRQSIFQSQATVDRIEARVGTTHRAPLALSIELGSKPHAIRPRHKKRLAFGVLNQDIVQSTETRRYHRTSGGKGIGQRTGMGRKVSGRAMTRWVYLRGVLHPGTAPHPFIMPAFRRLKDEIEATIKSEIQRATHRRGKRS